ncbi:hypothetical protein [Lacticaseibacillus kribbianus]|uniref:DUF1659 domain-containing protein n=1 Tax=Lacticaseibacillus kribbianus TaxID=2926292 RepID=UPI001CD40B4D|nr:hypothetical protein [Lacticaseibacillus kribbianus]
MQVLESLRLVYSYASDDDATDVITRSFSALALDAKDDEINAVGAALTGLTPGRHLSHIQLTKVYEVADDQPQTNA